jgi:hypothetical protein
MKGTVKSWNSERGFGFIEPSDPTGTPAVVSGTSVNVLGENFERTVSSWFQILLPAEVSLAANTV